MGPKGFANQCASSSPTLIGALSFSACWQRPLAMFSSRRKENKRANIRLWEADCSPDHTPSDPSSSRFSPTMRNKCNTRLAAHGILQIASVCTGTITAGKRQENPIHHSPPYHYIQNLWVTHPWRCQRPQWALGSLICW